MLDLVKGPPLEERHQVHAHLGLDVLPRRWLATATLGVLHVAITGLADGQAIANRATNLDLAHQGAQLRLGLRACEAGRVAG